MLSILESNNLMLGTPLLLLLLLVLLLLLWCVLTLANVLFMLSTFRYPSDNCVFASSCGCSSTDHSRWAVGGGLVIGWSSCQSVGVGWLPNSLALYTLLWLGRVSVPSALLVASLANAACVSSCGRASVCGCGCVSSALRHLH